MIDTHVLFKVDPKDVWSCVAFSISSPRNWRRTPFAGSSKARAMQFPRSHDILLFYSRGESWIWNQPTKPYSDEYLARFKWDDNDGRGPYRKTLLKTYSQATFQIDDVWVDVNAINPVAKERLGYPTQKPESLLERIITASSDEADTVLDPFCGCGTTIAVAHRLKRRWIGIDITHLAINLIRHRLRDAFGDDVTKTFTVIGEPVSLPDAETLAENDPYQFQWWALGLVGARPVEAKKGADKGIDGRLYFHDESEGGKTKQIILSVKSGNVVPAHLRDLRGVLDREKAEIGVLLTLEEPTKAMRKEAAGAGFYEPPGWGKKYPRLQILTIEELLAGKGIEYPPPSHRVDATFKKAPRVKRASPEQLPLAAKPKAPYQPKSN